MFKTELCARWKKTTCPWGAGPRVSLCVRSSLERATELRDPLHDLCFAASLEAGARAPAAHSVPPTATTSSRWLAGHSRSTRTSRSTTSTTSRRRRRGGDTSSRGGAGARGEVRPPRGPWPAARPGPPGAPRLAQHPPTEPRHPKRPPPQPPAVDTRPPPRGRLAAAATATVPTLAAAATTYSAAPPGPASRHPARCSSAHRCSGVV